MLDSVLDSGKLDVKAMRKLVKTIESRAAHERTAATLTLLKLCNCKFSSSSVYVADHG